MMFQVMIRIQGILFHAHAHGEMISTQVGNHFRSDFFSIGVRSSVVIR